MIASIARIARTATIATSARIASDVAYNQFMTIEETLDDIFAEGQKVGREEVAQKMRALIGV